MVPEKLKYTKDHEWLRLEGEKAYVITNRGELVCLDVQGQYNGNDGPYKDEAKHCVPDGEEHGEGQQQRRLARGL